MIRHKPLWFDRFPNSRRPSYPRLRGQLDAPVVIVGGGLTGAACALYACGPDAMLHAVAELAARHGVPARVSLDPWMGCGIGTCLGCVVRVQEADAPRSRLACACTEGPVFDADAVVWPGEASSRAAAGRRERTA